MPTSVAGSSLPKFVDRALPRHARHRGFTLLELMIVVAVVAIASGVAVVALRDSSESQLEQEAQRLAALLDGARARSRATGVPVTWSPNRGGFVFEPSVAGANAKWRHAGTGAVVISTSADQSTVRPAQLVLGPEPLIGAQAVRLTLGQKGVWVSTDGLRPFQLSAVQALEVIK